MTNNINTTTTTGRAGRLARFAAAAGITAATLVGGLGASTAQASDMAVDDVELAARGPITIDPIITIDGSKTPRLEPIIEPPCFGWWCNFQPIFLPDLVATSDFVPASCSTFAGQQARPYYFFIQNDGVIGSGAHWTTFASTNGEIVGVEPVNDFRLDLTAAPVSDTATQSAPLATSYLDDAWVMHDSDGTKAGERNYIRVWIDGCAVREVIAEANTHVGVDHLGSPTPAANYRIAETTRSNNRITINWFV